jgi:hypothetical protein
MSQRWDQGISEARNPGAADSLIPMFESMVDRAFSRSPREMQNNREIIEEKCVVHQIPISSKGVSTFSPRALPRELVR